MKIKELIEIFENLLVLYKEEQKRVPEKNSESSIVFSYGICYAADKIFQKNIYKIIKKHYENYISCYGYLFFPGDIEKRIEFMEKEIPYLKNLIKKGYTYL